MKFWPLSILLCLLGCGPTISIAPPSEPIVMNLNIKIEHKLKIEHEVDKAIKDKSIF